MTRAGNFAPRRLLAEDNSWQRHQPRQRASLSLNNPDLAWLTLDGLTLLQLWQMSQAGTAGSWLRAPSNGWATVDAALMAILGLLRTLLCSGSGSRIVAPSLAQPRHIYCRTAVLGTDGHKRPEMDGGWPGAALVREKGFSQNGYLYAA